MPRPPSPRPHRQAHPLAPALPLALALLLALALAAAPGSVAPAWGQQADEPLPTGNGVLVAPGGATTELPFLLDPRGPLVALRPVAAALGTALDVGPLGASHVLRFETDTVRVGPDTATAVVTPDEGRPEIVTLRQTPRRGPAGLYVPIEFLSSIVGDRLGLDFTWRPAELRLIVERRSLREIGATVNVVHQPRLSIVEVQLSQVPRYRIHRRDRALEIELVGDRFLLPLPGADDTDALVTGIDVAPQRLTLRLAPDAAAAEPRLLEGNRPRLVVEVFRQAEVRPRTVPGDDPADPAEGSRPTLERPAERPGLAVVVLDPGHGGVESGAVGTRGNAEKDLTLQVARRLERALRQRLPVRVLMTRDQDLEVPHESRTAFANHHKADLFISLHMNSTFGGSAHGAETYFLSREASDRMAAAVAEKENQGAIGDPDPESELQLILWDLAQTYHLAESQRFATLVQEELNETLGLRDRGVKQAPFKVLMGAAMPAVLVELGFLSNPEEEAKLEDAAYQGELVDALVRAVARFKTQLDASVRATTADTGGDGAGDESDESGDGDLP